ncbi:DEKNAAC101411 [Brettanomyces naardenensis]|uniref:DEKNAAC101411 n=1 Tax=Brettanomyces naardenensis TaxID=13370 RepID=A0A448YI92_BRENA|nr:DEKNAAC101411 [Brettanomyces naardenensis]
MTSNDGEDDLDDLDDLLDDFQDDILSKPPGATIKQSREQSKVDEDASAQIDGVKTTSETSRPPLQDSVPNGDQFDEFISEMARNDPELSNDLQDFLKSLTKEAGQGSSNDDTTTEHTAAEEQPKNKSFQDVISETVSRLKTSGTEVDKSIHEESKDDQLLATLMKSLDLDPLKLGDEGDGAGKADDINKLLVEMLDKLSSKSVLYEPMNDLYLKYGPWLSDTKNKTNPDYGKYQDQYVIVKKIVEKFEEVEYSDSDSKQKEFINSNLEELQELGMPPKELVNDDLNFLNFKGGAGGGGDKDLQNLEFGDDDIPGEVNKELNETCQQT